MTVTGCGDDDGRSGGAVARSGEPTVRRRRASVAALAAVLAAVVAVPLALVTPTAGAATGPRPLRDPDALVGPGGTVRGASGPTGGPASTVSSPGPMGPGGPGGPAPQSVIGPDGRVRVDPTTTWPARAIVLIQYAGGTCTGWLFSRDTVATAGHCVYDQHANRWRSAGSMRVWPGVNGAAAPYGSCGVRWTLSVSGWTQRELADYDYGFLRLDCTVGDRTGWLGYEYRNLSLVGTPISVAGYPGDKPARTQWRASGTVAGQTGRRLFSTVDTANGQSGSPVWTDRNLTGRACVCVLAVHAQGRVFTGRGEENAAVWINRDVYDNFQVARSRP